MKKQLSGRLDGFTLIELLVVVLIIGILAAVAVPQYQKAVEKARAVEAINYIRHLRDAQRLYFLANGSFASTWDELGVEPFSGNHKNAIVFKDFNYWFFTNTEGRVQTNHIKGIPYWIQAYAGSDDRIVCVASPSNTKSNQFCKSFSPEREDCIGEPSYNCYRIK